jgi:transposase
MNKRACGIDVSYKTFDIEFMINDKATFKKCYTNDHKGLKSFEKKLNKMKTTHVCLEATGNYHLDIALMINNIKEVKLMVINPRTAHNYSKVLNQKAKTDSEDAHVLAHFAAHMSYFEWQAPEEIMFSIRACGRRLSQITKQMTQLKNQKHAYETTEMTPEFVILDVALSINNLENQRCSLIENTLQIISSHTESKRMYDLIISIDGFSTKTAIKLIGELAVLDSDMKANQLVAHAGLNPTIFKSGKSINKTSRLSKAGNKYIREALYMSAMQMTYRNKNVAAYYEHMQNDNGLKKKQAICAIMRKMLMAIHGMIRDNVEFNANRFYRITVTK